MFKNDRGGVKAPSQSSKPQSTAVGSGARPNASKIAIDTSAPADAHTMGRSTSGYLK